LHFTKITSDYVLVPIEDMIEKIKRITNDPLAAAYEEEERILYEETANS
jgi:hypothetical protein